MTFWRRHWRAVLIIAGAAVIFGVGLTVGQRLNRPAPTATPSTSVIVSGPIIDAKTGASLVADVYVGGQLVQKGVSHMTVSVPMYADRRIELRVEAVGYQPWAFGIRGSGKDKRLDVPVRMVPAKPGTGQRGETYGSGTSQPSKERARQTGRPEFHSGGGSPSRPGAV